MLFKLMTPQRNTPSINKDKATVEMDANVISPLRFIDFSASLK